MILVTGNFPNGLFFRIEIYNMKTEVLVIGGGNAGISFASQLHRANSKLKISLVEPSEKHYYQPAWTLVGAGVYNAKDTERSMDSVMPKFVEWIKDKVISFQPERNEVTVLSGKVIEYEFNIVTGKQIGRAHV